jgi:hypothetical protein
MVALAGLVVVEETKPPVLQAVQVPEVKDMPAGLRPLLILTRATIVVVVVVLAALLHLTFRDPDFSILSETQLSLQVVVVLNLLHLLLVQQILVMEELVQEPVAQA